MNNKWTDQDLDALISSVEETLEKAEVLAKSAPLKKDANGKDDPAASPDDSAAAAPAQDAPADAAPADAQAAAPADAAPADPAAAPTDAPADPAAQQAAPAEGDQALGQEGEDAPLSDEELGQIYGSMAPDELERHYSIIRQQLQSAYAQDQGQQPAADPAAQQQQAAPAPDAQQQSAAPAPQDDQMMKSEDVNALKKQVADQAQALEQITKAFEALAKPSRKSITDIQFMAKSEADAGQAGNGKAMTKEEIKTQAAKLNPANLSKSERDMINAFYLRGESQDEVQKLINSKGGK
jgi:hypothetical protein